MAHSFFLGGEIGTDINYLLVLVVWLACWEPFRPPRIERHAAAWLVLHRMLEQALYPKKQRRTQRALLEQAKPKKVRLLPQEWQTARQERTTHWLPAQDPVGP